jgi:hypothetical protein
MRCAEKLHESPTSRKKREKWGTLWFVIEKRATRQQQLELATRLRAALTWASPLPDKELRPIGSNRAFWNSGTL